MKIEEVCLDLFGEMRDPTPEEREIVNKAIEKKSVDTGISIWDLYKREDGEKDEQETR